MSFDSVPAVFLDRVERSGDRTAFTFPVGDHDWRSWTWRELADRVRRVALGLVASGIEREQCCAILCSTRIEWILADLGINCAGAATTTVYPSNTPAECAHILADSASRIVFAEDANQVEKLQSERGRLTGVDRVVVIDGRASDDGWVMTLADLMERGAAYDDGRPHAFERIIEGIRPGHLATLAYTSGTTGVPRGVELTHDCWVSEGQAAARLGFVTADDHQFLWLPLSHSFGKMLEAAQLHIGFRTTIDGRLSRLVENLAIAKPTFMAAAPRVFEKVHNAVVSGAQAQGALARRLFRWSIGVGREVSRLRQQRRQPSGLLAAKFRLADWLVFSRLKQRFGGNLRFFISGSAPLSREMAEFFHAVDILILEGYGLTESSAATFINRPDSFVFGTVGRPFDGVEFRIAEDGEILVRGRGIMRGYHDRPEDTARTLSADGWLHTGDVGELREDGNLAITDRKKDLIKTSGGKYVAPQRLEGSLKAHCPWISQVVVHGDGRNYCTALITIDGDAIRSWAVARGLAGACYEELAASPAVRRLVQDAVDRVNTDLPSYATIKKFALLPRDLSVEHGELTPSMKVKRRVVEERYRDVLDAFYAGAVSRM